jgi:hypothetical protein
MTPVLEAPPCCMTCRVDGTFTSYALLRRPCQAPSQASDTGTKPGSNTGPPTLEAVAPAPKAVSLARVNVEVRVATSV